jgi:hypothetical protein
MWYHVACLGTPTDITQDQYLEKLFTSDKFLNTPRLICQVALQPTARGGLTHFTAGNIRIVYKARKLLFSPEERDLVRKSEWMAAHLIEESRSDMLDTDWEMWLKAEFGMDKPGSYEPLVVTDQLYYTCPECRSDSLI